MLRRGALQEQFQAEGCIQGKVPMGMVGEESAVLAMMIDCPGDVLLTRWLSPGYSLTQTVESGTVVPLRA